MATKKTGSGKRRPEKSSKKRAAASQSPATDASGATQAKESNAGRKLKLTAQVQEDICTALRSGNFFATACEFAGIPSYTGYEWLGRGEGRDKDRPPTPEFAQFAQAVQKAIAAGEAAALARIRQAARGGAVKERKKITRRIKGDPAQGVRDQVVTEDVEVLAMPQWQADAWYLERRHRERWARTVKTELTGPDGEKINLGVTGDLDVKVGMAADIAAIIGKIYGDEEPDDPADIPDDIADSDEQGANSSDE